MRAVVVALFRWNTKRSPYTRRMGRSAAVVVAGLLCVSSPALAGNISVDVFNQSLFVPASVGIPVMGTVTISSIGSTPLHITSIALIGPNSEFVVSGVPAMPATLAPTQSLDLTVTFTAQKASGLLHTTLEIQSDDPDAATLSVPLMGCAGPPAVGFDPPTISFGSVGNYAGPVEVSVFNAGCEDLGVSDLTFGGPSSSRFSYSTDSIVGTVVARAGEQARRFQVTFTPSGMLGDMSATVEVTAEAPASNATFAMTGTGLAGYLSSFPWGLFDFNGVITGTSSTRVLELQNPSTYDVEVQSISFSDPAFATVDLAIPFTIPAGGETPVNVSCSPAALGEVRAKVTVLSSGETYVLDVVCTGTRGFSLQSGSVDLGIHPLGVGDPSKTLFVSNATPADIDISWTIDGPDADEFGFELPDPFKLTTTGAAAPELSFLPLRLGPASATLHLSTTYPYDPEISIDLTGYGFAPSFTLSSDHIDVGTIVRGYPASAAVQVTNTGATTLVAQYDSPLRSVAATLTVPAGGTGEMLAGFTPTTLGAFSSQIEFHISEPPVVIPIRATVIEPTEAFEASPALVDFSTVEAGATSPIATATVSNSTSQTLRLVQLTTTDPAFVIIGASPTILAPGASCTAYVMFAPLPVDETATRHAELQVFLEAPPSAQFPMMDVPPVLIATVVVVGDVAAAARPGADDQAGGCNAGQRSSMWPWLVALALAMRGLQKRRR